MKRYLNAIKTINKRKQGDYYYAHVLELGGCQSTGENLEESYENLREAMEGW